MVHRIPHGLLWLDPAGAVRGLLLPLIMLTLLHMRSCLPLQCMNPFLVAVWPRIDYRNCTGQTRIGRPHHWVTPFLGKRGQIGLSRHNFASTAPFPDLSTPLDSLYFSSSDGGLGVEINAVSGRQFRKNGMLRWKSAR